MKHVDTLKFQDMPRLVSQMVLVEKDIWSTSSDYRVAIWNAETGNKINIILLVMKK